MSSRNSRPCTVKFGLRVVLLMCVAALLLAWWLDRRGIVAQLQRTQTALDDFREERNLPEPEKTLRRYRKVLGFDKIEIGMTVSEVEAELGGPGSFARTQMGKVVDTMTFKINDRPEVQKRENHQIYNVRQWQSGDAIIVVIFDDGGRVVCRY